MPQQKPLIIDAGTIKDLPSGDTLDLGAFTLPATDGTANQVLQTNGSGTVSWATMSGGTVTSVDGSGGTTGMTLSGGPITTTGTLTLGGTLGVANGGTGTSTAFTQGSIVFAGASGVYAQNNANLFWNNANTRLGIGGAASTYKLEVAGSDASFNAIRVGAGPGAFSGNVVLGTAETLAAATSSATNCVAIGANAQQNNQSGFRNVAIGTQALRANVSGTTNTAIGYFALDACTGSSNTAIGQGAGQNVTSGSNLTLIGAGAQPSSITATQEATIGGGLVDTFRIAAPSSNTAPNPGVTATTIQTRPAWNVGHNANSPSAPFATFLISGAIVGGIRQAAGGGTPLVYATSSDYRIKTDVQPIVDPLDRLASLKPCRFHFTTNPDGPFVEGFIAHEVQQVVPQAVVGVKDEVDAEGKPVHQGLDQAHLVPLLTAVCQALHDKNQQLEARLAALEAAFAAKP